ncbi:MAG: hypothetical protein DWQ01_14620 [Planctomycetota bacterium]|nr:MAG: hypothetical protein DWQ01_14620 [Planctomycetota bacterium]
MLSPDLGSPFSRFLPRWRLAVVLLPAALLGWLAACGGKEKANPTDAFHLWFQRSPEQRLAQAPEEVRSCQPCHRQVVADWLQNGMSDTLGPLPEPFRQHLFQQGEEDALRQWHQNPRSQSRYRVETPTDQNGHATLAIVEERLGVDGGPNTRRSQELGYRIGAGVHAISLVAREGPRWFFAPLEYFNNVGFVLAPTEFRNQPLGLTRTITNECLACHTTDPLPESFPLNHLQDAMPVGLSCNSCHGPGDAHVAKMTALKQSDREQAYDGVSEILNPAGLPAERQLDLCARCHLQGDARLELTPDGTPRAVPGENLFQRRAAYVPKNPGPDYGFVSQVHRLSLSACFQQSPDMSCASCHDSHAPPRVQGRQSFLDACQSCHPQGHVRSGASMKGGDCVSCHMRLSQPFDLGHMEVHDHWVRIRPPAPEHFSTLREIETTDGQIQRYRYRAGGGHEFSAREEAAMKAMALAHLGNTAGALREFQTLPAPGSPEAIRGTKDEGPWPVLELPMMHFVRGRSLYESRDLAQAEAAYRDALKLDPKLAEARINLAWILVELERLDEAQDIVQGLLVDLPDSEAPWNLMAVVAEKKQRPEDVEEAFQESLKRNPTQAAIWRALGQHRISRKRYSEAMQAFQQAYTVDPKLPGLSVDIRKLAQSIGGNF